MPEICPTCGGRMRGHDPTPRELEVLALYAGGRSAKEIAGVLGISPRTVETHRASVMRKSHSRNRVELVMWAVRKGLVKLDEAD